MQKSENVSLSSLKMRKFQCLDVQHLDCVQGRYVRRPIETFYLLAPKLVFHKLGSRQIDHSKVGDLEVFPKAPLDLETYTRP